MVKLSEFMTGGSIFTSIENYQPLPFLGDGQNVVMDRLLTLQYGDRLLYTKIIGLSFPEIAQMIVMLHGDKWDNLILVDSVNKTASKTRTITETTTNVENRTNSKDDKNLLAAYNDNELIVNDGRLSNGVDDLNGTETRTMTDETIDLKTAYNNLSLSEKNNIMNTVLYDVASFITLIIY